VYALTKPSLQRSWYEERSSCVLASVLASKGDKSEGFGLPCRFVHETSDVRDRYAAAIAAPHSMSAESQPELGRL
jgi:hypothetical protein